MTISTAEALARTPEAKADAAFKAMIVESFEHLTDQRIRKIAAFVHRELMEQYDCTGHGYVTDHRDRDLTALGRIYNDRHLGNLMDEPCRQADRTVRLVNACKEIAELMAD